MSMLKCLTILRPIWIKAGSIPINTTSRLISNFGNDKDSQSLEMTNIPMIDYDDPDFLRIPEYPAKINESIEKKRQRLLYQSRKRGMLENDLLLSTFASKFLKDMDANNLKLYDRLINGPSNDWDIYYWAIGNKPTPSEYDTSVMNMLKKHAKNTHKEKRLRQPNLY